MTAGYAVTFVTVKKNQIRELCGSKKHSVASNAER